MQFSCPNLFGVSICGKTKARRSVRLTFCVESWLVPRFFTSINMDPSPLVLAVHFCPDMIFTIPYPSDSCPSRSAEHSETIRPFSGPAPLCLEESPNIRVPRESFIGATATFTAPVQFHSRGTSRGFVGCWWGDTLCYCGRPTDWTVRVIHVCEEGALKPSVHRDEPRGQSCG